jgi:circadian clock protein KaiB
MNGEHLIINVFIAGMTPAARRTVANLEAICDAMESTMSYELKLTDIIQTPQAAEDFRILATPTTVRESPPPQRRVVGDLSDRDQALEKLELVLPVASRSGGGPV